MDRTSRLCLTAAAVGALSMLACRESPPGRGAVTLSVTTRAVTDSGAAIQAGDTIVVARGADTIVIRQADLVLRETVLQRARYQECEEEEGEDCAVLRAGAIRLRLPLDAAVASIVTMPVPVDTYSTLQFEIYRPDRRLDSAFLAAQPDLAGTSVRARGTFSRAGARHDFDYASEFNEVQEVLLGGPLPAPAGSRGRVTLHVDVGSWFLTADGAALIDPASATPDGDDEIQIRDNIRLSLHASVGADSVAALRVPSSP